jgi:hypothetical protein
MSLRHSSIKLEGFKYDVNLNNILKAPQAYDKTAQIITKNNLAKKNYSSSMPDINFDKKYQINSKLNSYNFYQSDKMIG